MIKIFLTVRNRLAMTKKCIYALKAHSKLKQQIYVYDNNSNYLVKEHFEYFGKIYEKGLISQVCFTTKDSTFNAFSKASTCNFFGQQHLQDPQKDKYSFMVMLDNDIVVTPGWDLKILEAWKYITNNKLNNIKIVGQLPGGIKNRTETHNIGDIKGRVGILGGSGLWAVRNNFFDDVGFLNLKELVGHDKQHDQRYWTLLSKASKGKPYIMGLNQKLGIHCGSMAGSICNKLTKHKGGTERDKIIRFEHAEQKIDGMSFDEFYESIKNDKRLIGDW